MTTPRRTVLTSAAALLALAPATGASAAEDVPAGAPGKPGDFDFLTGEWRIKHRQKPPGKDWISYEGEATCWGILGGVCSIEELRIPSRGFSGMGLRLLDLETKVWRDHWVSGKSGVIFTPGQAGRFIDGAGVFTADDMDGDKPIKVKGVWDEITKTSCRWSQALSYDGGRIWEHNWMMAWTRA